MGCLSGKMWFSPSDFLPTVKSQGALISIWPPQSHVGRIPIISTWSWTAPIPPDAAPFCTWTCLYFFDLFAVCGYVHSFVGLGLWAKLQQCNHNWCGQYWVFVLCWPCVLRWTLRLAYCLLVKERLDVWTVICVRIYVCICRYIVATANSMKISVK